MKKPRKYWLRYLHGHLPKACRGKALSRALHREYRKFGALYVKHCAMERSTK